MDLINFVNIQPKFTFIVFIFLSFIFPVWKSGRKWRGKSDFIFFCLKFPVSQKYSMSFHIFHLPTTNV